MRRESWVIWLHVEHQGCVCRLQEFEGADVRFGSVADRASLSTAAFTEPIDVVVSCLASRTGGKVHSFVVLPCFVIEVD